ncbi:MAG: DUF86 domain-containing protein [Phycisphaerae bacterium]|nr:DUF86 domain-containing protein [Phycisphaerae bacterium]
MRRDDATLLDIARAARQALEFTLGMDKAGFLQDAKTRSAVLHQLMVIGEAVKRLSSDFRSAHADTPWALIAGMRDKLIHAYDEVDLDQVWKTLERDIPAVLKQIEPILPMDSP